MIPPVIDQPGPLTNGKASIAGWEKNPNGGKRESLDNLSPLLNNNDVTNNYYYYNVRHFVGQARQVP